MGAAEHIELETWELFMAVMESGSYLQPARAMNVDPSTVSRRLRKLEDRLRCSSSIVRAPVSVLQQPAAGS